MNTIIEFYDKRIFQNNENELFIVLDIKECENTIKLCLYPLWLKEEYDNVKQTYSHKCLGNFDTNKLTKIVCEIPNNLKTQNFDELLSHKTSRYFGNSIFIKDDNSCPFDYKLYYTNQEIYYFGEPYRIIYAVINQEYIVFKISFGETIKYCTILQDFHNNLHSVKFGSLSLIQTAKKTKELRNEISRLEDRLKFLQTNVIEPTWHLFEKEIYEDELNINVGYGETVSIRKTKDKAFNINHYTEF